MDSKTISWVMMLRLSTARCDDRLAPSLDASPLLERELEYRRRRVAHGDVELRLLVSRMLAHEAGRLPTASVH